MTEKAMSGMNINNGLVYMRYNGYICGWEMNLLWLYQKIADDLIIFIYWWWWWIVMWQRERERVCMRERWGFCSDLYGCKIILYQKFKTYLWRCCNMFFVSFVLFDIVLCLSMLFRWSNIINRTDSHWRIIIIQHCKPCRSDRK